MPTIKRQLESINEHSEDETLEMELKNVMVTDYHDDKYLLFISNVKYGSEHKVLEKYATPCLYSEKLFQNRTLKQFRLAGDEKNNCILYCNISEKSCRDYLQQELNKDHGYKIIILYKKVLSDKMDKKQWYEEVEEAYDAVAVNMKAFLKSAASSISWEDFYYSMLNFGKKIKHPKSFLKSLLCFFCCKG